MLTPYTPALFPVTNWMAGLGTLPQGGVPFATAYGGVGQMEYQLSTPEMTAEFAGIGLVMIGSQFNQAFDMLCTKPVKTLADAAGKRIRTGGQLWSLEAQALGMQPVPLVPTELYEGFSRGIVDCLSLHVNGYYDLGLLGVPGKKYYTPVELSGWNASFTVINKDKWDSLPASAKRILRENYPLLLETLWEGVVNRHAQFSKEIADKTYDVEVLLPDASLVDAIAAFHASYLTGMLTSAPASVKDPAAVIERAKQSLAKWRQIALDSGISPVPTETAARMASYANPPDLAPFLEKFRAELSAGE
jgi:TRAP-type mannitol/chloroaromatic compound transport system substrate-binding protein